MTVALEAVRWARNRERYGLDAHALARLREKLPAIRIVDARSGFCVAEWPDFFSFMSSLVTVALLSGDWKRGGHWQLPTHAELVRALRAGILGDEPWWGHFGGPTPPSWVRGLRFESEVLP